MNFHYFKNDDIGANRQRCSLGIIYLLFFVLLGEGYIFGGGTAKQGELPFMALLGYITEYNEIRYQCGGALINRFAS